MHIICDKIWKEPSVFLNLYLPLRLHPMTRGVINNIINAHKPKLDVEVDENGELTKGNQDDTDLYYYGIMMMDRTVVTIFKQNKDIAVRPADINMIHLFSQTNLNEKRELSETEFWREMCLPGMTEDFRLPVFFSYFPDKN